MLLKSSLRNGRLAFRFLKSQPGFVLSFSLGLSAGLVGLMVIQTLKVSIQEGLTSRSRSLLGADLVVSSRRPLNEAELKIMNNRVGPPTLQWIDLLSMMEAKGDPRGSRMVSVRAIDSRYPGYGKLELSAPSVEPSSKPRSQTHPRIDLPESLAKELGIVPGDPISIGGIRYRFNGAVKTDTTLALAGFSIAPRVYVPYSTLEHSNLTSLGTTAQRTFAYIVKGANNKGASDDTLKALEKTLNTELDDPGIRIRTHLSSSEDSSRLLRTVGDFLGLVSMSALVLASLGVVFQFRRFFLSQGKNIALILTLGGTFEMALSIVIFEVLFLGLLASLLSFVFSWTLIPWLSPWLSKLSPTPFALQFNVGTSLLFLVTGVLGSLLLCLPEILKLRSISPTGLFREDAIYLQASRALSSRFRNALGFLPVVLCFFVLSVILSQSFKLGIGFAAGVLVSAVFLALLAEGALTILKKLSTRFRYPYGLRHLIRASGTTRLLVLTLGLSTLLMGLIPEIRLVLERQIRGGANAALLPTLFLFDIQDEQEARLKAVLEKEAKSLGVKIQQSSPLIRARLLQVNGKPFEKTVKNNDSSFQTREDEQEAGLRNRGFNLTIRQNLSRWETLLKGRELMPISKNEDPTVAEISVETRFAERLDLHLNDVLEFDIQGVPLSARIVNLRRVEWTQFQPNFFIQFQEGFLEESPKSWVTTVKVDPPSNKIQVQRLLSKQFANVSAVDVQEVIEWFSDLTRQIVFILTLLSIWTAVSGFLTLSALLSFDAKTREGEMNLLIVLGARPGFLQRTALLEGALTAVFSGGIGVILGFALSMALSIFVFDTPLDTLLHWQAQGPLLGVGLQVFGVAALLCIAIKARVTQKLWGKNPRELLGSAV